MAETEPPHFWLSLSRSAWAPATRCFSGSRSPRPPWKATSSATRLTPSTTWRSCGRLGMGEEVWAGLAPYGAPRGIPLSRLWGHLRPQGLWVLLRAELVWGWGGGKHPGPEVSPKFRYKLLCCVWPEADPRAYLSHTLPIKWEEQEVHFIVMLQCIWHMVNLQPMVVRTSCLLTVLMKRSVLHLPNRHLETCWKLPREG